MTGDVCVGWHAMTKVSGFPASQRFAPEGPDPQKRRCEMCLRRLEGSGERTAGRRRRCLQRGSSCWAGWCRSRVLLDRPMAASRRCWSWWMNAQVVPGSLWKNSTAVVSAKAIHQVRSPPLQATYVANACMCLKAAIAVKLVYVSRLSVFTAVSCMWT